MKNNKIQVILFFAVMFLFTDCKDELSILSANWECYEIPELTAEAGDMQIVLTWTTNPEAKPEGFHLTYTPNDDSIFVAADVSSYTIKGLTNKTKYTFTMQADYGSRGKSALKKVTATPVTSRYPVTKLTLTGGNKAIKASWVKPASDLVTGYVITLTPGDLQVNVDDPNETTKIIEQLENNIQYTVSVCAKYAIGDSNPVSAKVTLINLLPVITSRTTAIMNAPITFSMNPSYFLKPVSSVSWDFGDGKTTDTANPEHIYTKEGEFTVSITVNHTDGESETSSINIMVESRLIVLCEQNKNSILIVDSVTQKKVWEWYPSDVGLPLNRISWFKNLDEAKPVYNKKYILITASAGGGVAMVRIADKKIMFYTCPDANTHSAEVLPDGNIVVACSTGDTEANNKLLVYKVDTLNPYVTTYHSKVDVYSAHNAVWDKKKQRLMATANNKMNIYTYNFDKNDPQLHLTEQINLSGTGAHELFPVYGENALWLTTRDYISKYNIESKTETIVNFSLPNIKSISSGPAGYGILLINPKESYYTDEITNSNGGSAFYGKNYKMYKARWFVDNQFSYEKNAEFRQP